MREVALEQHLTRQVERHGGVALKLVSPGNSGVPDRLVILPHVSGLLELKRPGERPRSLQHRWLERLTTLGHHAGWAGSHPDVDAWLAALVARQRRMQQWLQENPWN